MTETPATIWTEATVRHDHGTLIGPLFALPFDGGLLDENEFGKCSVCGKHFAYQHMHEEEWSGEHYCDACQHAAEMNFSDCYWRSLAGPIQTEAELSAAQAAKAKEVA